MIKKLKTKKPRRTLDVKMVFIKYANPVILKLLHDIFNVFLSEGTYPDLLKIAEVPIFKKAIFKNFLIFKNLYKDVRLFKDCLFTDF